MFGIKKGDYGYIKKRKLEQLLLAVLMGAIGFAIYGIGYVVNGYSRNNICLVLGILMVLPAAKFLTTFILLIPYKTPKKEDYEDIKKLVDKSAVLWSDLVITSTEKVMNLDFLYIGNRCVYGMTSQKKTGAAEINAYLTKGVRNWSNGYNVKIVDSKESFHKLLKGITPKEIDLKEEENVKDYLHSLIV